MTTRRLYYDDPFLRTFEAQVKSCEPTLAEQSPAWAVTLDQSAFYPTSGGQPFDTGKIANRPVIDVSDDGDEVLHILREPVDIGRVVGCVDWDRRFDHMQQHTGQHLLSAILQERFGLPTISFHLGSVTSTIDVRGREPGPEILEGAERAANAVIFEDRPVTVRYGTAPELAEVGVRKEVEREGILRAIEIEGIDLQPCGGTHVNRTGQLGLVLIRGLSKIRQDWRLEFVCGGRAERTARADRGTVRRASELLKCAEEELTASVERLQKERETQFKSLRATSERMAQAEARLILQHVSASGDGLRIVGRVLQGVEPIYLAAFATQIAQCEGAVGLLARRECGHVVFAQHPLVGKDMNALLKKTLERFGGKGGGTRDFARGALAKPEDADAAISAAARLLEASGQG
jgi:alanyl-tRNA synthetase